MDISTLNRIKSAPIEDRIQFMEAILQSLKNDLRYKNIEADKAKLKQFKVRKFNLGEEIKADRNEIYSERGL